MENGDSGALRDVFARADALVRQFAPRDAAARVVRAAREGRFDEIAPGAFPEDYPAPIIANRIDTMARDMVASLSPLPSFNCVPTNTLRDNAKAFAAKRTKIAHHYVESSHLQAQMPEAADSFSTHGLFAVRVEPDREAGCPKIRVLDGAQVYPVWDKDLRTVEVVEIMWVHPFALQALHPGLKEEMSRYGGGSVDRVRIMRFEDKSHSVVWLPDYGNRVLEHKPNELGRCTYVCVPRPSGRAWTAVPRGAYDDLVWPMIAANELRLLALEATHKSVGAPVAVPMDVHEVPFGPDAVIHTNNPEQIRRLELRVPTEAFQATELLDRDMQSGGMSPSARSGAVNASIITGAGVDALGEGYSAQVALYHDRLGWALEQAVSLCFEMDEKLWPNVTKEIRGQRASSPFSVSYTPAKDIAGDWTVAVDYGFLLGLDPNRALVFILQGFGAGLFSAETADRYLPMQLNLEEEQAKVKLEQLRNSLVQAMSAMGQAIPQLVLNGQDPAPIVSAIAKAIEDVKKGRAIEVAVREALAPEPPPQQAQPQQPGVDPNAQPGAPGAPLPQGVRPEIATEGQGGRPDLTQLFAGLTSSGAPNLGAVVSRMAPAVGGA